MIEISGSGEGDKEICPTPGPDLQLVFKERRCCTGDVENRCRLQQRSEKPQLDVALTQALHCVIYISRQS